MKTIVLAALLTALSAGWLVHPLMKGQHTQRAGFAVMTLMAIAALALYLLLGRPDLP